MELKSGDLVKLVHPVYDPEEEIAGIWFVQGQSWMDGPGTLFGAECGVYLGQERVTQPLHQLSRRKKNGRMGRFLVDIFLFGGHRVSLNRELVEAVPMNLQR
jgi:hypothetical protein|tara:strand:- start:760 stop:1065 length:306 start_codon:yes stop_codon:yes gene_type:complete